MKKIVHGDIKGVKQRAKLQSHLFPNSTVPHRIPKELKKSVIWMNHENE